MWPRLFHDTPCKTALHVTPNRTGRNLSLADKIRVVVEHTWNKERRKLPETAHSCITRLQIIPCQKVVAPSRTGVGPNFKSCQPDIKALVR